MRCRLTAFIGLLVDGVLATDTCSSVGFCASCNPRWRAVDSPATHSFGTLQDVTQVIGYEQ